MPLFLTSLYLFEKEEKVQKKKKDFPQKFPLFAPFDSKSWKSWAHMSPLKSAFGPHESAFSSHESAFGQI